MRTTYLILLLALLAWKGYHAWLRGRATWNYDRKHCKSLEEYLLGNGAKRFEALLPFVRHALQRALMPLCRQWRLWLIVAAIGILVWIVTK